MRTPSTAPGRIPTIHRRALHQWMTLTRELSVNEWSPNQVFNASTFDKQMPRKTTESTSNHCSASGRWRYGSLARLAG